MATALEAFGKHLKAGRVIRILKVPPHMWHCADLFAFL
jgi:hypothetical protein